MDVIEAEAEVVGSNGAPAPAPVDATPIHFVYTKRATKVRFAVGFAGWLVTQHVKGPGQPVRDLATGLPLFVAPEVDPKTLRQHIPPGSGTCFNLLQCRREPDGCFAVIEDAEAAYCELGEPAAPVDAAPPVAPAPPGPPVEALRAAFDMVGKALEEQRATLREVREAFQATVKANREHTSALLEAFAPRVKLREGNEGGSEAELSEEDSALVKDVVELVKPAFAALSPDLVQVAKRWLSGAARGKSAEIEVTPKGDS